MSHLSESKANTSPSTRLPLSTRAAPICKAPHRHSASRIHSQAGLAVGPLALLVFRPRLNPQRPPPRRSGPLLSPSWAGGSRAGLSPTWSRSADFSRRPGVCPPGALSPPAASLALKPPPLPGGSSPRGGSACSLSPPDSGATRGGAAAPSSLAAGCPSLLPGWGLPSRSPPPLRSSPPWAAPGGTPGATAPVPDSALATLLRLGCSAPLPLGAIAPPAGQKSLRLRQRPALGPGRQRALGGSPPRPWSPSGGFD